jgi:hypothetical protein
MENDLINLDTNEKVMLLFKKDKKDSLKPLEAFFTCEEYLKFAFITSHPKIKSLIKERLNTQYQQNLTDNVTEEDCLKETGLTFLNHCISHCIVCNIEKIKEDSDDALLFMKKFFRIVVTEDNDKINSLVEDPKCLKYIHVLFIQLRDTIVNKK